ncbi:hypothetical protein QC762_602270 [Podospora pseudocomata]|uniref:Fungal STAND N-terminal Goodbye domain-containing protein n=1 Tax=Podospora pseudocomata TaxID=2093779 RepID=A0ABR0G7G3_9PEZI|nr:hypothetical protein QC762_602270 [Podospora pseudocomata]
MSTKAPNTNRGLGTLVDSYVRKRLRRDIHPAFAKVRDKSEAESTFLKATGAELRVSCHTAVGASEDGSQSPTSIAMVAGENDCGISLEEIYRDATQEKLRFQLAIADYEKLTSGPKFGSGITTKPSFTWEDVLEEAQRAADTYSEASGMWNKIRKGLCSFGRNAKAFDAWASLLPSQSEYLSVLCGGLKFILGAAARLHDLNSDVCDALAEIPILLKSTHLVLGIFKRSKDLHQASADLYSAIIAALHHIVLWYREKAIKTLFKSILKQDAYAIQLTELLSNVRQQADRFEHVVRLNSYERIVTTSEMVRTQGVQQDENHSILVRYLDDANNELHNFREEFSSKAVDLQSQVSELTNVLAAFLGSGAWMNARTHDVRGPYLPIRKAKSESRLIRDSSPGSLPHGSKTRHRLEETIYTLDYDSSVIERDIATSLRSVWQVPVSDQDRLVAAIQSPKLQSWIMETTSSALFLNFNATRNHHTTSFVAAKLANSIQSSSVLVVTFFCGPHTDRRSEDPDFGVTGMMRCLISQLLLTYPNFGLHTLRQIQEKDMDDVEDLCEIFYLLVAQLPRHKALFCILDSVTNFEDNNILRVESEMAMGQLMEIITWTAEYGCCFKLLLTSPRNSRVLYKHLSNPEQDSIWLPAKVPSQGGFTKGKWDGSIGGEVDKLTIF